MSTAETEHALVSEPADAVQSGAVATSFSVIVPAYNEEAAIEATLVQLHKALRDAGCRYEIIVVNDGSTDRTGAILSDRDDVRVVQHVRNLGYGAALKTGIRHAKHPLIVITDSDGTYPNERIPDLVGLAESADMVVGSRSGENVEYPFMRKIPKWFLKRFAEWMVHRPIPDLNSGLRVLRKEVVERFHQSWAIALHSVQRLRMH